MLESVRKYNLDEAFEYCAKITETHYENFPVASLFLPEEKRPYIQAIYAFSRIADNFADEFHLSKDERLSKLNDWEEKLQACFAGDASHPIFIALHETIKKLEIPIEPLSDLIHAFKQDVTQHRYQTFSELLGYCKRSANPVGRLVLMIFNYRDEKLFELSDYICTALQLTNFWQDVKIDREKDRLYIPLEDMKKFKYEIHKWHMGEVDDNFKRLIKFEVHRTRDIFYRGAELPSLVAKELQLELKLIWFGGIGILKKIQKIDYNVINERPHLKKIDKMLILFRALIFNDLRYYKRKRPRKEPWDLT